MTSYKIEKWTNISQSSKLYIFIISKNIYTYAFILFNCGSDTDLAMFKT